MHSRSRTALWAIALFVLVTIFVVSAWAMVLGGHRILYDQAPAAAQAELHPTSHEPKPSATIGVVDPARKTVAKSKQARRTPRKGNDR
jgi:hypothetical protein